MIPGAALLQDKAGQRPEAKTRPRKSGKIAAVTLAAGLLAIGWVVWPAPPKPVIASCSSCTARNSQMAERRAALAALAERQATGAPLANQP